MKCRRHYRHVGRRAEWQHDGIHVAPPFYFSPDYSFWRNVKLPSPIRARFRYAVDGEASISAHVIRLLLMRGPTAIFRAVVPVIVFSVQSVPERRSAARIFQEPARANLDASATIDFVASALWVLAAPPHVNPDLVFRTRLSTELSTVTK